MFSLISTGTWRCPSWTAMVWPTISGKTVEARAHVRITFWSRLLLSFSTFSRRLLSMKGPFLVERDTYFFSRRRMISLSEAFFGFRVR